MTSKLWEVMNDLEMVTSKIVSAREIIDTAAEAIQRNEYDKAETLAMAAYEFLGYYLDEFDAKFKLAWQETVVKQKKEEEDAWDAVNREKNYYEPSMPPWGHSDMEALQYTEEEMDAMCDKAASDQEKEQCQEYNLREAEYYNNRAKLDAELEQIHQAGGYEWTPLVENAKSKYYYDYNRNDLNRENPFLKYDEAVAAGWTMTDDGFWIPPQNKKTWVLPVEQTFDDYFVSFPDDLLKAANLKENDQVEWIDNGNNTYTLRKVTKLSPGESYDDMIAAGYTMTDDGFWIPPQNKKTWVLPVEQTFDDYFVSFPDDLLKAANLKENDQVEWVDNGDNTYTLHKVTKLSRGECYDDFENPCDMVES